MQNDPELSGKFLGTITEDFIKISDTLKEAAYHIRQRHISDFPIFPICKHQQPIGSLLIAKEEVNLLWNYYASFSKEFLERTIFDEEGLAYFEKNYKDSEEFCCLFVVDQEFTKFLFVPYPED
ncbi:MAG: hypothetical protein EAZ97_00875 [Bacteroidetes bacterium]|nr:MAG: hypothetical protein EAZ97_00875 [Bacteroidota bacterium]